MIDTQIQLHYFFVKQYNRGNHFYFFKKKTWGFPSQSEMGDNPEGTSKFGIKPYLSFAAIITIKLYFLVILYIFLKHCRVFPLFENVGGKPLRMFF